MKSPGSEMPSGCGWYLFRIFMWALSVALLSMGAILLLFGIFSLSPVLDTRTVVATVVAPVGLYLLLRVGRGIWRDLTESPRKGDRVDKG
jgi:arginine exporter protein ArgO